MVFAVVWNVGATRYKTLKSSKTDPSLAIFGYSMLEVYTDAIPCER